MNEGGREYDVAVVGAGMVGATAASLLARSGFSVAVIEPRVPVAFDSVADVGLRVSAISPGSARVLEQAGAWQAIEGQRIVRIGRVATERNAFQRHGVGSFRWLDAKGTHQLLK